MVYLLRLEDKNGNGPFRNDVILHAAKGFRKFDPCKIMSTPCGKGEIKEIDNKRKYSNVYKLFYYENFIKTKEYFFGLENEESYLQFMKYKRARKNLADIGVLLKIYKINKRYVVYGYQQLVFKKEYATIVHELEPDYIDKGMSIPSYYKL